MCSCHRNREWKMPDGSTLAATRVSSWTEWERYTVDEKGLATRMVRAYSKKDVNAAWDAGDNLVRNA